MEKLEILGPWSRTKGGSVDPKGEMDHRSAWVKAARGEVEKLQEAEMAPQEESAEIQSPRRKVIPVESEETQDYVFETLAISQEETQEIAFVPSALSDSQGPIHWCDNRCSENAVRCWHFASVVVDEGGEAHTINLRQQCCNEQMVQQGQAAAEIVAMESSGGKKTASRENLESDGRTNNLYGECGEYFTLKGAEVKKIPEDASREQQEVIQGQWQQESPFRIQEQVRGHAEVGCGSQMMRRGKPCKKGTAVGKSSKKETGKKTSHRNGLSKEYAKLSKKVAWDEIGRLGIVHFHRSVAWEESLCRIFALVATAFLWRTTLGGCQRDTETETTERRSIAVGGVRCVEANTSGGHPTEFWLCSSVPMPMKHRCSQRTRLHKGYART